MKTFVLLILLIECWKQVSAHYDSTTVEELVCKQCRARCGSGVESSMSPRMVVTGPRVQQGHRGVPGPMGKPGRVGLQGEIGPPGPRGPASVMNVKVIEDLIDKKIKAALLRLPIQTCKECPSRTEKAQNNAVEALPQLPAETCKDCSTGNEEAQNVTALPSSSKYAQSCREVQDRDAKARNDTGGLFDISIPELGLTEVYCDTTTDGGGWMVFQRRMDGSVEFFRRWNDYVNGFGNKQGEFWLGLEAVYQMTKNADHELRIDMIKTDGTHHYAKYRSFFLGPASDKYRLSVSGYSGNSTNGLNHNDHRPFSTKDRDHDLASGNCALQRHGAWWHGGCGDTSLNGVFGGIGWKGIVWGASSDHNRFTEIKFRKKILKYR